MMFRYIWAWLQALFGYVKVWLLEAHDSAWLGAAPAMEEEPVTVSLGPIGPLFQQLRSVIASLQGNSRRLKLKGVKAQIQILGQELEGFCIDLKGRSEAPADAMTMCWMGQVRDLCYDTADYLDELMHFIHYSSGIRRRRIRYRLFGRNRLLRSNTFRVSRRLTWLSLPKLKKMRRAPLIVKLSALVARVEDADESHQRFKLSPPTSSKPDYAQAAAFMPQTPPQLHIDNLNELLALNGNEMEKNLKVVTIFGSSGVGKTAIARALYHQHGGRFQHRAFIRVSRDPDMRRLLTDMLSQIKAPLPHAFSDVQGLIGHITQHLQGKRYLIIIDDLWSTSTWDIIIRALPAGDYCRIITTTQVEDVALACCSYELKHIYQITPLNDDQSGKSEGGCTTYPSSEGMKEALNLVYNNLPPRLKTCLLYLNMYPEGCTLRKDELVKQWVAEDFISSVQGQDIEDTAGCYFDTLVSSGLVQSVDTNHSGEVLSCTLHHMVLDLIRQKSMEENFVTIVNYFQTILGLPDKVRRLSVQLGGAKGANNIPENMRISQVRSLLFSGFFKRAPSIVHYGLLQVLVLHIWSDKDEIFDLATIGGLYRLRYLKIECNITVKLPHNIQRLRHLGTLQVDSRLRSVPSGIVHLEKLLHLRLPSESVLPHGVGHMTCLRSLGYFDLGRNSEDNLRDLGDLKNLQDLQLTCSTLQPGESLENNMQLLGSVLKKLSILQSVTLVPTTDSSKWLGEADVSRMCISCDSLCTVSPAPAHLQRLELSYRCCIFSKLPKWLGELAKLRILKIAVGELLKENIDILKVLPALAVLSLHLRTMTAERIVFGKGGFKVLTYFKFTCTVSWLKFEVDAMPNLEKLKLSFNSLIVDEQGAASIIIEHLSSGIREISANICCTGVDSRSALLKAIRNDPRNPEVQLMGSIYYDDVDRGTVTREGSGEEENNEAHSRIHMLLKSSRPPVPVHCREEELEDRPSICDIISIPSESGSTYGHIGQVKIHRLPRTGDESVLERILNGDEDPMDLPLSLLQSITNDFSQETKIGQGGFGEVYKGELQSGIIVAVKRIYVNQHTIDDKLFRREVNSLRKINHQNIVRFLGFCSNTHHISREEAGEINLVNVRERILCFEYIRNGSLDKHITDELRGLEWEPRYAIISGICKGLFYLHEEKNIVHMDLKPANILLDDHMVPKITDFGLSRSNELPHTTGQRFGTPRYVAPEYKKDCITSCKCDIYSLGVIIIELVTGHRSVPHKNNVLRRWRHRWNKPPTLLQCRQVTRCIEIAERCRQQEPEARPSIGDIMGILSESKSTDGHIGQGSTYLDDDMLGIQPLELKFDEKMSWSVKLTNKTKACFAFSIEIPSKQYTIEPDKGIVTPGCSECLVQISVTAPQVTQNADKLIVRSTKVNEGLRVEDITKDIFHEVAGKVVDEVDLMVVYEPTKPQENCKSREDTNMPADQVPEEKNRKIVGSASGKGKLVNSENAEASLVRYKDINSSTRGHCTEQTEQYKFYPPQSFSHHYLTNTTYLGKGSRAVDVTRGAMGSLLDKLGKLIKENYNLDSSMKRDIESFSEDLAKIHKDLPNLEKLDGVDICGEVRELSYNIEDMVDSFVVRIEPDSSRSVFRELPHEGLKFLENDMTTHHQIGDVIRDIKKQVQVVVDRQKKYNFDDNNVVANATASPPIDPRMAIYINKEQLIGIEARTNEIIRMFEEDGDVSKQERRIVSIVGLGGLGKTTLAKAVYDKLKAQYHCKAFVPVGQSSDVKKALKDILFEFGEDFYAANLEVWQLKDRLKEYLQDKRYLIVIDDIWDPEAWGLVTSAFPRNNHGSRVITTTRIERVARACCEDESKNVYRMSPLSVEDSRRLFLRRIFGPGKDCPNAQKDISNDILKRCGGMPLAINSIASLLAGEPESTWDYARKTLGAMIEGNDLGKMKQILDLSYMHLPVHLKTCLLYVCMYPEDREIEKNELLRKWVAEGFVRVSTNSGLDAEDVAEKYFEDLINMCMIQPGKIDYYNNEVISCRVHDIILDLMRSKSSNENFIHVTDGSKFEIGEIRRVSVQYNVEEDTRILETMNKGSLSHVRSVLLCRSSLVPYFMQFKYVRVLHIEHEYCFRNNHLDLTGISRLFLLRYLKVASGLGCELKLPNQIGELQQLETIDIAGNRLENWPSDIVSLPWLSHLSLRRIRGGVVLPDGIDRLRSLRTLEGVDVCKSSVQNIKGLNRLTNLRKLQISSNGSGESVEETTMDALYSSICKLSTNLRIFTFEGASACIRVVPVWITRTPFPRGSQFRELDLPGCQFERCPEWIGQLHHLYKLRITVREVADGMSIVARLPLLACFDMCISVMGGVEEKEESVVIPGTGSGAFRALKHLCFYCPKASLTFEAGAMPKLEELDILFRDDMAPQFLPVGIQHLPAPTLEQIRLCVQHDQYYQYYLSSDSDKSREHTRKLGAMLKRAFKQHHPGADIFIRIGGDEYVGDDKEDFEGADDEEGRLQ